jgi:Fe2+ transport system protein FeoA
MTLNDLKEKDVAVIDSVSNERLQQLGIVPSKTVTVLRRIPCCLHIRIGTTEWAIRDQDAKAVTLTPIDRKK